MKNSGWMIGAFSLFLMSGQPVLALSDAECASKWKAADVNGDGVVSESEGGQFYTALRTANKPIEAGKLDQATYLRHCKEGAFDVAKTHAEQGAPFEGANSFTEAQAKERIEQAGLKDVSKLEKDAKGVWRGTAHNGTKTVPVAVDFRGNVVAK